MTTTTTGAASASNEHIEAKREAIANANAHVANVGLPLYSHIAELLREALQLKPEDALDRIIWIEKATAAVQALPEQKYLVMNRSGLYLSKLGASSSWVVDEADAEVMGRVDAQILARLEGASVVPVE